MRRLEIAVAGAGPAGLTAALFLARAGHRVIVFERFETPKPLGSGLVLQPTGLERFSVLLNRWDSVFDGFVIQDAGWLGGQPLMTAPLSNDLRERVVLAIEAGETCRSVAARFEVSVSAAVKWSQRYRATGSVAPSKMGGHRKRILEPHRAFIIERVNQTSHLTLHGLKDELAARGVKASHDTIWKFLRREGLSFKKNTVRP